MSKEQVDNKEIHDLRENFSIQIREIKLRQSKWSRLRRKIYLKMSGTYWKARQIRNILSLFWSIIG